METTPHQPLGAGSEVIVVGAGVAGASCAHALAQRGVSVTVLDAGPGRAAQGGSHNLCGIVAPQVVAADTPLRRFSLSAFHFATRTFRSLGLDRTGAWLQCGSAELLPRERALRRARDGALGAAGVRYLTDASSVDDFLGSASERSLQGAEAGGGGAAGVELCDAAGTVHGPSMVQAMLHSSALIQVRSGVTVGGVVPSRSLHARAAVLGTGGELVQEADAVVVAAGVDSARLLAAPWLPIGVTRGAVLHYELASAPPGQSAASRALSFGGYCAPVPAAAASHTSQERAAREGRLRLFGATFDSMGCASELNCAEWEANVTGVDEERVLRLVPRWLTPLLDPSSPLRVVGGGVGGRATAADHAPVVGPVPDARRFTSMFGWLRHSKVPPRGWVGGLPWDETASRRASPIAGAYLRGVHVCTALGTRGLTTAPLLGQLAAAQLCGGTLPVEARVAAALHPARFLVKAIARRSPM